MSQSPDPPYPRVTLRKDAHKRLGSGHPWVYSNEVNMDASTKALPAGSVVTVADAGGTALATAHFNPRTFIAVRALAVAPDIVIDQKFFATRFSAALSLRERFFHEPFYRLIHAEADGLPGLVVDRFDDAVVLQPNTAGMECLLDTIVSALDVVLSPQVIVIRGDGPARNLEGIENTVRCERGNLDGPIAVQENGATFFADLVAGQKTGWFFDQRENRAFMASISRNKRALDLYTYTGGFALACARRCRNCDGD